MTTLQIILITSYIPFIFIARWLNYLWAFKHEVLFYRGDLHPATWFLPVGNVIISFYYLFELLVDYAAYSDIRFLQWLFFTHSYITDKEAQERINFQEAQDEMGKDKNYNSNDDFLNYK